MSMAMKLRVEAIVGIIESLAGVIEANPIEITQSVSQRLLTRKDKNQSEFRTMLETGLAGALLLPGDEGLKPDPKLQAAKFEDALNEQTDRMVASGRLRPPEKRSQCSTGPASGLAVVSAE